MIVLQEGNRRFNYRIVGLAIDRDRVLLHRMVTDDFWALPGGRAEMMEKATDTLRREMVEEINCEVSVGRLLWVVENFFDFDAVSFHELALYFLMTLPGESPLCAQETFYGLEGGGRLIFRWFPLAELATLRLYPSFLRQGLLALPAETQHVVHFDDDA